MAITFLSVVGHVRAVVCFESRWWRQVRLAVVKARCMVYWQLGGQYDGSPWVDWQPGRCCGRWKVCGVTSLGVVAAFGLMRLRPWKRSVDSVGFQASWSNVWAPSWSFLHTNLTTHRWYHYPCVVWSRSSEKHLYTLSFWSRRVLIVWHFWRDSGVLVLGRQFFWRHKRENSLTYNRQALMTHIFFDLCTP